jgi:hypothetical protein
MTRSTWLVAIGAVLAIASAQAAVAQGTENSQQDKMKSCNADAKAKSLTGDARKSYLSSCLSSKGVSNSQQEKMKSCNADASTKGLKGDDRKAYMKTCLSGSSAAH